MYNHVIALANVAFLQAAVFFSILYFVQFILISFYHIIYVLCVAQVGIECANCVRVCWIADRIKSRAVAVNEMPASEIPYVDNSMNLQKSSLSHSL